jgi:hypothetical protein
VHTDLVRDALTARHRPLVRLLRMGHGLPLPRYFDIVDPTLTVVIPTATVRVVVQSRLPSAVEPARRVSDVTADVPVGAAPAIAEVV